MHITNVSILTNEIKRYSKEAGSYLKSIDDGSFLLDDLIANTLSIEEYMVDIEEYINELKDKIAALEIGGDYY